MRGRGMRALRGNALARRTDQGRLRLRRALRCALVLLAVPAAALALLTRAAALPQLASAATHRHAVTATVLGPAPVQEVNAARVPAVGGGGVKVEWTYPAGAVHEAAVRSRLGVAATRVPLWVDDAGVLAAAPPTATTVTVDAVVYGLGAWCCGALALALAYVLLRRGLDRRDARAWADEWAEVEPYWSGRRRHGTADR